MIKYILAALALGVAAGYVVNNFSSGFPNVLVTDYLLSAALYILLFVMGLTFAIDKEAVAKLKATGLKLLIVPVLVILGSILGGLVAGLIFQLDLFGSMAVTAGYGWYTLTGSSAHSDAGNHVGRLGICSQLFARIVDNCHHHTAGKT